MSYQLQNSVIDEAAQMAGVDRLDARHAVDSEDITIVDMSDGIYLFGRDGLSYGGDTVEDALSDWLFIRV